ncbi:uncharacterized protein LOC127794775 [Diospyros lotus]|uniref:uncharacterized protein LOC127794775 n=1 Tax=Diospyros lotus TaxID=55363 RepID=UPI00224D2AA7|nr:uncharacterized protein LOC127794775 [Diospyros lotus]
MERKMMDATSRGVIVNKTPTVARDLISIMAANSQQFGFRQDTPARRVNEVSISSLENQISNLTSLIQQLAIGNLQQVKACGICAATGHPTDMCPTLQEDSLEHANAVGGFPGPPQRKYDPYSNTYNLGWRDHPNFSYGARPQFQHYQPRPYIPPQQPSSSSSMLESQGKLPSQTVINPKQNASAITLRSGKELEEPSKMKQRILGEESEKEVVPQPQTDKPKGLNIEQPKALVTNPPFPTRLNKSEKEEEGKEMLETFHKIEELCTNKRKLKGNEKVSMGKNVSAVLQKKLPPKCKDLGVIIQLADRSNVYPEGVLEVVLVQVNELAFPTDFYVLNMEEGTSLLKD